MVSEEQIINWCKELLPKSSQDRVELTALKDERSRSFKLIWGDQAFFLKLTKPDEDISLEAQALQVLSEQSVAPKHIAHNNNILITEFLKGEELNKLDEKVIEGIIATSTRITQTRIPQDCTLPRTNKHKKLLEYYDKVISLDLSKENRNLIEGCWEQYLTTIKEQTEDIPAKRIIHSNPNRPNWMNVKGTYYLVDWEEAYIGDFAEYLAELIGSLKINPTLINHQHEINDEQIQQIITAFESIEPHISQRVQQKMLSFWMDHILWYAHKEFMLSQNPYQFKENEQERIQRQKALVKKNFLQSVQAYNSGI